MNKKLFLILAGLACLMLMAAGCTGTSDKTPATPAVEAKSWSGIWSTTWTSADHATLVQGDDITFTQTGSSVTGAYINPEYNFTGSITGTVDGATLTGIWSESENGIPGTSGTIEFVMSADKNSFNGTWEHENDANKTTYLWNGVRK